MEWVRALLTILLKYRAVTGVGRRAADLVDLSKNLRALRGLLRDRTRTRAVVVTRAADLPLTETMRLLTAPHRLGIAVAADVVNAVAPARYPDYRAGQGAARVGRALRRRAPRLLAVPAVATPTRGAAALARGAATWRPGGG